MYNDILTENFIFWYFNSGTFNKYPKMRSKLFNTYHWQLYYCNND